jgi:hypothetical protein
LIQAGERNLGLPPGEALRLRRIGKPPGLSIRAFLQPVLANGLHFGRLYEKK